MGTCDNLSLNVFADTSRGVYCFLCSSSARDNIKIQLPVCGVSGCSWDRPPGFPLRQSPGDPLALHTSSWRAGRSPALVNPQLSCPFGPFVAHRGSHPLFLGVVMLLWVAGLEQGGAWPSGTLTAGGSWSALLLLIRSGESAGTGAELCKNKSRC